MTIVRYLRAGRQRLAMLAALLATLAAGLFAGASAQGQSCRDLANLTVCADRIDPQSVGPDDIFAKGNIKLGPRGAPPVVHVTDLEDPAEGGFFRALEGRVHVIGAVRLINDPSAEPLVSSLRADTEGGDLTGVGSLFVDPVNLRIFNPAEAVPGGPFQRNQLLDFTFIDRTAVLKLGDVPNDKVDVVFDLQARTFSATMPVNINGHDAENQAALPVAVQVRIGEDGKPTTSLADFKTRLGGMTAAVKQITVDPPSSDPAAPGGFSAGVVEFTRADNPELPNLDPSRPELVFRLANLKYRDGRYAIEGAAPLADWQLGNAMRLTRQSLTLGLDQLTGTYVFTISSTLDFSAPDAALKDPRAYPVTLRLTAQKVGGGFKPIVQAALPTLAPSLALGPLSLQPQGLALLFDPVQNFYGLTAERLNLQWGGALGGQRVAGGAGLRLGINRDSDLIFGLGGAIVETPELRTRALVGKLRGTIGAEKRVITARLDGILKVALPGNGNVAPTAALILRSGPGVGAPCPVGQSCDSPKAFELSLTAFDLNLAGFKLGLANVQGTADGGFAVERAALTVPAGITGLGGEIRNLRVSGAGDVSIAGGGIELPPLSVGGFQFVGLKGFFARAPAGGYEFKAAGTMPLPGLDPNVGRGKRIGAELTFRTRQDGAFQGTGVVVDFNTGSPGIPIPGTGMELLQIKGSFDSTSGTTKVGVFMRASSQLRVAGLPVASVTGNAELQARPFKVTANARLSVLVFNVANASVGYGAGQGFSGGPGFNVSFDVDLVLVRGEATLRIGEVTMSNGQKRVAVAARALLRVGIKKNAIVRFVPPRDINVASAELKGGHFRVRGGGETIGLMGTVKVSVPLLPDPKFTVFVDLKDQDVKIVDTDKYTLIGAATVRARAAASVAGYSSRSLDATEAQTLGLAGVAARAGGLQETIPVVVDHPGMALFGISYPKGAPGLRLQLPDGTILTEQSVDGERAGFLRDSGAGVEDHELAFLLESAQPGTYIMLVDNAPAQYEKVSYVINNEPELRAVSASCGGAPAPGVTVTCAGAPAGAAVSVSWDASDIDSPNATARVGFVPVAEGGAPDLSSLRLIADGLPLGQQSVAWDLSEVPTGRYHVVVGVDDGKHAPVEQLAAPLIVVTDRRAPATPDRDSFAARALPGGLQVNWAPNGERDLAGYEIGFARSRDGELVYTRDLGDKEAIPVPGQGDGDLIDVQLWGLEDDEEIWFAVRAYDASGNYSPWSERSNAKPWPVAPGAWLPLPESRASTRTRVEVAFATPLMPDKYLGMLELRDASGAPVAGTAERVTNLDGDKVVGLRFTPSAPLEDGRRYEVFLNGDRDGLSTLDGRMMPADYTWSFTADASLEPLPLPGDPGAGSSLYLPLVGR